jgi:hypothetical protein
MVQKLNHSELKDITDIVYYTNLKQKAPLLQMGGNCSLIYSV